MSIKRTTQTVLVYIELLSTEMLTKTLFSVFDAHTFCLSVEGTNPIFDKVSALELHLLNSYVQKNQFDQWIEWTRAGKMWQFPIDNEQGKCFLRTF